MVFDITMEEEKDKDFLQGIWRGQAYNTIFDVTNKK